MSVTGVLLMYEKQIIAWADQREYRAAPPSPGAARLPDESPARGSPRDARPAFPPRVTFRADPTRPGSVRVSDAKRRVYVNPYTGEVLGAGIARGVRDFLPRRSRTGIAGSARTAKTAPTGRAITGRLQPGVSVPRHAAASISGCRETGRGRSVRAVTWFRGGLAGKARDFNWHNVFGFWWPCRCSSSCCPAL